MRIEVVVKPNARKEAVEKLPDGSYRVSVNAPPQEGRANEAVIALLAKFFKIPKSSITILRGERGRRKLIEFRSEPRQPLRS
jgi:uncharacterized protein (TIGR00251 family)